MESITSKNYPYENVGIALADNYEPSWNLLLPKKVLRKNTKMPLQIISHWSFTLFGRQSLTISFKALCNIFVYST